MRIQYIGFLPALVIFIFAHWKVIEFYRKHGTLSYWGNCEGGGEDIFIYVIICIILDAIITSVGLTWGLS